MQIEWHTVKLAFGKLQTMLEKPEYMLGGVLIEPKSALAPLFQIAKVTSAGIAHMGASDNLAIENSLRVCVHARQRTTC